MERAKLVIVGAGPAGIATAVEAKTAGITPVIILEKFDKPCETIHKFYHPGKRVDPVYRKVKIEPLGVCRFDTCTKEEFLELIDRYIRDYDLDIRFKQTVQKIEKINDCFRVHGKDLVIEAPIVVVAIGIFGRPVKPGYPIPKEIKNRVFFGTQSQIAPEFKKVLVVGGGDSAAETACFLADKAEVYLSYRRPQFFRINETNLAELNKRVEEGKIKLLMNTNIEGLEPAEDGRVKVLFKEIEPMVFDAVYYCLGGSTPENFLKSIGVEVEGKRAKVDEYGETNLPGLFLAGDLVVEKGSIMAAFNSAHKVIEGIKKRYQERLARGCE